MVAALKFENPEIERETYIAAFVSSLVDKGHDRMTLDDAAMLLILEGYDIRSIGKYLSDAFSRLDKPKPSN